MSSIHSPDRTLLTPIVCAPLAVGIGLLLCVFKILWLPCE